MRSGLAALAAVRADRWADRAGSGAGAVLMMHRVRPAVPDVFRPNAHLEITPDFLDTLLRTLAENRVPVVDLAEAAQRIADPRRERFAVLTFDDGYRDNLVHAVPVLTRHKVPFTVFVATGMIDGTSSAWWMVLEEALRRNDRLRADALRLGTLPVATAEAKRRQFDRLARHLRDLDERSRDRAARWLATDNGVDIPAMLSREMMSWDDMRQLAQVPGAEIGGHTVGHGALAQLSESDAVREVVDGLDRLQHELGVRPRHFAYPYGDDLAVSERDIRLVRRLGIDVAVTTRPGLIGREHADHPTAWPRVSINGHHQSRRVLDLLLSGVPFLVGDLGRRLMPGLPLAGPAAAPLHLRRD